MIEAKELRKVYKTKKGLVVKALDGVSVRLPDTGMVFILGKSGSGKSTLLNVLGGLDSFDSGEIIIKGTSAKDFKQSHYDSYRNTYIGFIFQEYNILEELTVGANVALAIELQGRKATNEEVDAILREVDLDGYGSRKPNELSGGQKQRVAIARALVKKPEIIMADEPTGALDSATGKQVFDTLKKLSRDKLVLIVSHDREFSEQYADRIIELKDGVIISDVEKEAAEGAENELESSIIYGENDITVKPGYEITEEDRIAINKHLAALSSGAVIKLGSGKKRVSSKDFRPTDEAKIKSNKQGDFKLIKSKLSLKNAFKLGSSALNHKKIRLVITILLSLVAFTLFGLADTIAAYDSIGTATSSIYDTGVDYASYVKMIKRTSGDYTYWRTDNTYLTTEDIQVIKTETGRDVVGVYKKNSELSYSGNMGKKEVEGMNPALLYASYFSGLTPIDENLLNEHGFTLLPGSRLPEANKNEIVITKYAYEYFSKVGYVTFTNEGEVKSDITKYEDLIGKSLNIDLSYNGSNTYTIVGIVDTKFDYSRYEKLAAEDAAFTLNAIELMALTSELQSAQLYSFACIGFVNGQMLTDILAEKEGSAERLDNAGNMNLYTVVDDNILEEKDIYGETGENVISDKWIGALNSLSNVKDKVIWVGAPLEALSDNQIILPTSVVMDMLSSNRGMPDAWYEPSKLVGFEKTMYDNYESGEWQIMYYPSLDGIISVPKYFAAYSYAYAHPEAARAAIISALGYDAETAQNEFKSDSDVYYRFAEMANYESYDEINAIVTEAVVNDYLNGIVSRYNLADKKMSEDLKNKLIASTVYNGKTYYSYDRNDLFLTVNFVQNYNGIAARKYAVENIADAMDYYMRRHSLNYSELLNVPGENIIDEYTGYILYGSSEVDGFKPTATVDFNTYKARLVMEVYRSMPNAEKMLLSCNSYLTGNNQIVKQIEIVGVISEAGKGGFIEYGNESIVVSDNIINMMLGPNRGGIYNYAVGVMPTDKAGVREVVKFSKTYLNEAGDVKYQLTNNVTYQLGMVDELLGVLGQVFLYVGIGFAVFASLMLTNFIGTSITHKKQEIGILRAIGSRSADVFRIFFAESFIIAMLNYVLSLAGTLSMAMVINNLLRNEAGLLITFLDFGIRQVGVLLGVSLGVAFIATFFPVKKIASMKPIDAIKNRK